MQMKSLIPQQSIICPIEIKMENLSLEIIPGTVMGSQDDKIYEKKPEIYFVGRQNGFFI